MKKGRLEETLRLLSSQLFNASEDQKYKFDIQTCLSAPYFSLIRCLLFVAFGR